MVELSIEEKAEGVELPVEEDLGGVELFEEEDAERWLSIDISTFDFLMYVLHDSFTPFLSL